MMTAWRRSSTAAQRPVCADRRSALSRRPQEIADKDPALRQLPDRGALCSRPAAGRFSFRIAVDLALSRLYRLEGIVKLFHDVFGARPADGVAEIALSISGLPE